MSAHHITAHHSPLLGVLVALHPSVAPFPPESSLHDLATSRGLGRCWRTPVATYRYQATKHGKPMDRINEGHQRRVKSEQEKEMALKKAFLARGEERSAAGYNYLPPWPGSLPFKAKRFLLRDSGENQNDYLLYIIIAVVIATVTATTVHVNYAVRQKNRPDSAMRTPPCSTALTQKASPTCTTVAAGAEKHSRTRPINYCSIAPIAPTSGG